MKVDRSRFLLLAAALSANGCTIINNTTADAGPDADTGTTADTGADATTDDSSSDVSTDGASDASGDATSDGSETLCTDEGPAVTPCSGTAADGGGCILDGLPQCTSYANYFKPAVAKKAVDCLSALPTCEGTPDPVYACGYSALEGACPDSTVDAYCTALVAACPSVDAGADAATDGGLSIDMLAQCKLYAGGLNADGRARLQTLVVTEGGCTTPLRDVLPNL